METNIDYTDKTMEISSNERKWINRVHELAKVYPEQVNIMFEPEQNYGMIYATLPASWLKINPPRKTRQLSDKEKDMKRKIIADARSKRKYLKEMESNGRRN